MENKTILKRIPEGGCYYDFEEETCFKDSFYDRVIISGNRNFISFGKKELIDIINYEYYDEELGYNYDNIEELNKITGKRWAPYKFTGYSQGEWQRVFYIVDEVSTEELDFLENFYFGKIDEFTVEDDDEFYNVSIPHDVVWKESKQAICEYLGMNPHNTTVLFDDGYKRVYNYKELK